MPGWEEPPLTAHQLRRIHAQLGGWGVRARPERLARLGRILGREVSSTKDLTMVEADRVTDALIRDEIGAA
jgi:hypothetical protein